jgi:hypothetical protein
MTPTVDELLRDPLFQLNAVLWMTQPLPAVSETIPVFYRSGFTVYAIAPLLALPPDLRLAAQNEGIRIKDRVRPDVVLAQESENKFGFTECKAESFSPESSTTEQARSLFLMAGPRAADVLGLTRSQVSESLLIYILPESSRELLTDTLTSLYQELNDAGLPTGQFSILGFIAGDVAISIKVDSPGSTFLSVPAGIHVFLQRESGTDPRPLYFIPYDPDVEQSRQERAFCKRVLFERMQSTVVAAAGRAIPPTQLLLETQSILNDAMFGMYENWENRDSARNMRKLCRQFMGNLMQAVNSSIPETIKYDHGEGWKIKLLDPENHETVLDSLTRFSIETLDLEREPHPNLFDGLEGSDN